MPLIGPISSETIVAEFTSESTFELDGAASKRLRMTLVSDSTFSLALRADLTGSITMDSESDFSIFGRVNGEANEFGSITMDSESDFSIGVDLTKRGKIVMSSESDFSIDGLLSEADEDTLSIVLTILGPNPPAHGERISARLNVDGVYYPIRDAVFDEPRNAAGATLGVTLQRPADREAIEAAESFKFEIYVGNTWVEMFNSGRRSAGGFSFGWSDISPADTLTLSTIGPIADRLNASPPLGLTVYDPTRETLRTIDFPILYDSEGHSYPRELTPITALSIRSLLEYILVDQAGFAQVQTDLPDAPVRRADFEMSGSWLDGLAAHIGFADPLIFVVGDVVWILDSTQAIPEGFAEPIELTADNYKSAAFQDSVLNLDGYIVTFADNEKDFDYTVDHTVDDEPEIIGTFGDPNYQEITRSRTFRDFYKFINPFVPVRTEKTREVEETRTFVNGDFILVNKIVEDINFDGFGKLATINKTVTGRIRDLTSGYPISGETNIRLERTVFDYKPDVQNPRREVLAKTTKTIQGLIVTDSTNQHLDEPFRQEYTDGLRAGNLSSDQSIGFGPIRTITETYEQNLKGQTEVRPKTIDFLTTPPSVINSTTDVRQGDGSVNARSSTANQVIVWRTREYSRTTKILGELSVGELPYKYAEAVARRRLSRDFTRSGTVTLKGLALDRGRGFTFNLKDRDGEAAGSYITEGRRITLSNLGTTNQNSTQSLEVSKI